MEWIWAVIELGLVIALILTFRWERRKHREAKKRWKELI